MTNDLALRCTLAREACDRAADAAGPGAALDPQRLQKARSLALLATELLSDEG